MVDCPAYYALEKKEFWENILKGFVFEDNYFVFLNKKSNLKINDILEPKYSTYELISLVLLKYIQIRGCSSLAGSNYDNFLLLQAAISDLVDEDTLLFWKNTFYNKYRTELDIKKLIWPSA